MPKSAKPHPGQLWFTIFLGMVLLCFFLGSLGFSSRARLTPMLVSGFGIVLCITEFINTYIKLKKEGVNGQPSERFIKIGGKLPQLVGLFAVYPLLLWMAGYLIATFVECMLGLMLTSYPVKKWIPIISAIVTIVLYITFKQFLLVPLPSGLLGIG